MERYFINTASFVEDKWDELRFNLTHKLGLNDPYPALPFVMIGDSGREDPVIYRDIVKEFPGRILAIYIRDVQLPERKKIAINVSE